jgi:aspartate ammonia-lyase
MNRAHPRLIHALALVKKSAAQVNMESGRLPEDVARNIGQAADEIMHNHWKDQFSVDPLLSGAAGVDLNVSQVIADRAAELMGRPEGGVDATNHVRLGQSPNDVFPTAMRLAILSSFKELEPVLLDLERLLRRKSLEFEKVVKTGRVHLQDSLPVSLGQEFNAFGSSIERSYRRMVEASHSLFEMNIGGLATGTGASGSIAFANRMVELLSHHSGLRLKPAEDHFRLSQSCSDFLEFSSSLRELAVELIKVANDLRLLGSGPKAGLYEISLPAVEAPEDAAVPVLTESVNMVAYKVIGNDTAVMLAAQAGQLELNAMTPLVVS